MENMRNCTQCSEADDMQRSRLHENCSQNNCSQDDCRNWAVGMAYVPWQNMGQVHEPAQALRAGTLFPELEKPFHGGSMRKGARR